MSTQVLIGVMATVCVVAVYFWLVRTRPSESEAR